MEMVAASKMRKAQERMYAARPYAEKIRRSSRTWPCAHRVSPPFLMDRPDVKRVGYIVISTDRGLCGGLNTNLFRPPPVDARSGRPTGGKRTVYGRHQGCGLLPPSGRSLPPCRHLGDTPLDRGSGRQREGHVRPLPRRRIDRIYLVHNVFPQHDDAEAGDGLLVPVSARVERSMLRTAGITCTSPMRRCCWTPCWSATSNRWCIGLVEPRLRNGGAHDRDEVGLGQRRQPHRRIAARLHKARQAAITQELSEIVAGAAAV